jgi:serine phosphatase RsbU (regulator of sigma subunit)
MNLRGMFMAMTMAKIQGNQLTVSCAGMPPVLIYRSEIKRVEEIFIKAMPLGSPLVAPYEQREILLASGDCLLLMSDGFPEMFNEKDEMIGFDKAKRLLSVIAAEEPAQEIIDRFVEAGETWAGKRSPDDDVTFVVLKVKGKDEGK